MEEKAPSGSIQEMIERYNRELMKTYHSTASSTGGQPQRTAAGHTAKRQLAG